MEVLFEVGARGDAAASGSDATRKKKAGASTTKTTRQAISRSAYMSTPLVLITGGPMLPSNALTWSINKKKCSPQRGANGYRYKLVTWTTRFQCRCSSCLDCLLLVSTCSRRSFGGRVVVIFVTAAWGEVAELPSTAVNCSDSVVHAVQPRVGVDRLFPADAVGVFPGLGERLLVFSELSVFTPKVQDFTSTSSARSTAEVLSTCLLLFIATLPRHATAASMGVLLVFCFLGLDFINCVGAGCMTFAN